MLLLALLIEALFGGYHLNEFRERNLHLSLNIKTLDQSRHQYEVLEIE